MFGKMKPIKVVEVRNVFSPLCKLLFFSKPNTTKTTDQREKSFVGKTLKMQCPRLVHWRKNKSRPVDPSIRYAQKLRKRS